MKFHNMNYVLLFSILTGVFAICTAIAQRNKELQSDNERMKDKSEIISLQKQNNSALQETNILQKDIINSNSNLTKAQELIILSNDKLNVAQSELVLSSGKLVDAYKKIEELNIKQYNYQSGGNSFGYVVISGILDADGSDVYQFYFEKEGEFPLYNVSLHYWNLDDFNNPRSDGRLSVSDFEKYTNITLGDLPLGGSSFGNLFKIKDGYTRINFSIHSKNGNFSQQLRVFREGKKMATCLKVNTITDGKTKPKIIKEFIDKNYPHNADGSINW